MEGDKSLGPALKQVGDFVSGLTAGQCLLIVGGAGLVAGVLWLSVFLIGQPKYTVLYSGLKPAEAQALAGRLAAKNIAYQLSSDGGSVLVPADKLDSARLETAAQGLPRNARLGFELFDSPNWAGSDFTEKVNYQRALEGELERTLQTLSEVEAVRVHLVLPPESVFTEREHLAKAAVIVKTRGAALSESAQLSITQLVASAVENLKPENVTVIDAESNSPMVGRRNGVGGSGYDSGQELSLAVLRTLEPIVGAGHVKATVHAEYDSSTDEQTQEIYDPKSAVAISMQRTEERAGGVAAAGVPGTASNVPGAQGAAAAKAAEQERQSSTSESGTYAVNKTVRRTLQPAGRLRRLAAAVLVDDAIETKEEAGKKVTTHRKRTPEEMKDIEQLARAAIGIENTRGDILAVENISFQQPAPEKTPTRPGWFELVRITVNQWIAVLRLMGVVALFAAVYVLLLRPVKKQVLAAFKELPARVAQSAKTAKVGTSAAAASSLEALEIAGLPEGSDEARAAALRKHLAEKVRKEPANAGRLVQNWIREPKR